ncbi:MAG: translation elongation factor EF-1beta [archaeon]|nr:translation elongation factor EF-1beta [archaeon]
MAEIYSVYDLLPEGDEADLNAVCAKMADLVPEGVKVQKSDVVDHVFGLMKIRVELLINADDESIGGKLEDALLSIEGIGNIECVSSTNV